jgi:hypothetical protein
MNSKRLKETSSSHARIHGSPGERPRLAGLFRAIGPIFIVIAVAGALVHAALPFPPIGSATAGVLFLVLAAALAVAVATSRRRLESYLKGARGEEYVAHELSFLPAGYDVFHGLARSSDSIMGREGDFDHVVVGPTGVFVIETKNWDGSITVEDGKILYNGQAPSRPPLEQVRQAAADLRDKLREASETELQPRPVVCFATDAVQGGSRTVEGVLVCNTRVLNEFITAGNDAGRPLSEQTQARVAAYLKRWMNDDG